MTEFQASCMLIILTIHSGMFVVITVWLSKIYIELKGLRDDINRHK